MNLLLLPMQPLPDGTPFACLKATVPSANVAEPVTASRAASTININGSPMTTPIYIRARNPDNGARVVEELLALGIPRERLEVHGREIPAGLSVPAKRWRDRNMTLLPAALIGAVALPLLGALILGGIDPSVLLVLALLGAGAGLLSARGRLQDTRGRFGSQQQALRRGDLLIVAEVDHSDIERVENQIAERHPEVLVLGSDPGGSPPFP